MFGNYLKLSTESKDYGDVDEIFFVLLIFLTYLGTSVNADTEVQGRKVGMWVLMLWFNDGDYTPWKSYVRLHPKKERYTSSDIDFIDYTIQSAVDMGVDYLILDNTNGVFRHNGKFDQIIKLYIERVKYLKVNLKISIAIGWSVYQKLDLKLFKKSVAHLEQYFNDPVYYDLKGKPLLTIYVNPTSTIATLEGCIECSHLINESDAFGFRNYLKDIAVRYASGSDKWIKDKYGVYGWKYEYPQAIGPTMGVMPGWDRSHNELTG